MNTVEKSPQPPLQGGVTDLLHTIGCRLTDSDKFAGESVIFPLVKGVGGIFESRNDVGIDWLACMLHNRLAA